MVLDRTMKDIFDVRLILVMFTIVKSNEYVGLYSPLKSLSMKWKT